MPETVYMVRKRMTRVIELNRLQTSVATGRYLVVDELMTFRQK